MKFQWTKGDTSPIYSDALFIRRHVFIEEQQIDEVIELDNLDDQCIHWVGYHDDEPIATARILPLDQHTLKIQRVAVLKAHRQSGAGHQLMTAIESWARDQQYHQCVLSAQDSVIPFYQSLGYHFVSDEGYLEAGIPHHDMMKDLTDA